MLNIMLVVRDLNHKGGVVSYFNSLLPFLNQNNKLSITPFFVGQKIDNKSSFHPLTDQIKYIRRLNNQRPDLIHINPSLGFKSFLRDGLFIWQAKRKKIPVLVFFHGWDKYFERKVNDYLLFFFKQTFLKADCFIVLSSEFKKTLIDWGVQYKKIFLGSTSVDERLVSGFKIEERFNRIHNNRGCIKILFLSRILPEKGIYDTIDALKILIKNGYNVQLTVAGDGSALNNAKAYSCNIGLTNSHVSFLGYVRGDDKIKAFIQNDIYCLPSYGEGMPTSVLEAMAFGMPIITTNVGGIKDFFKDNKMGFIVKANNPSDVALKIMKLLENQKLRQNISFNNYIFANQNFMSGAVAETITRIYEDIGMEYAR